MRRYETTFIIDGLLNETDREAIIRKYESFLKKQGVEIERIIRWGKRFLAYEIKKRTQGYYIIFYYTANPSIISSFHHDLSINENILRFMTLIFDGKYPEYIRDETVSSTEEHSYQLAKSNENVEQEIDKIEDEVDITDLEDTPENEKDKETNDLSENTQDLNENTDLDGIENNSEEEK